MQLLGAIRHTSFVLVMACAACGDSSTDREDVAHGCGDLQEGQACDFEDPCRTFYDFWEGLCGNKAWTCEGGRVRYEDHTFSCAFDVGPPPRDAGPPLDAGRLGDATLPDDAGSTEWCADYTPPPALTTTECHDEADCMGSGAFGSCWAPGDTTPFYNSGDCPRDCMGDSDCGDGRVCDPFNSGVCAVCVARCDADTCRTWEECGEDGHCRPQSCANGFACPPGSECGGASPADSHGCGIVACTSDADCGCGACVLGHCALGPGRCEPARA